MTLQTKEVLRPRHYSWIQDEIDIDPQTIIQLFNFNLGNTLKYIIRNGRKQYAELNKVESAIMDLQKARNYLNAEIQRLEAINAKAKEIATCYDNIKRVAPDEVSKFIDNAHTEAEILAKSILQDQ